MALPPSRALIHFFNTTHKSPIKSFFSGSEFLLSMKYAEDKITYQQMFSNDKQPSPEHRKTFQSHDLFLLFRDILNKWTKLAFWGELGRNELDPSDQEDS